MLVEEKTSKTIFLLNSLHTDNKYKVLVEKYKMEKPAGKILLISNSNKDVRRF